LQKIIVGGSFKELKAVKAGRRNGKEIPNTIKLGKLPLFPKTFQD